MTSPILVVGAGPVGLTLAAELTRHGAAVRIIESTLAPSDKSRAIGVHARTLEVFEDMGIADRAVAEGRRIVATNVHGDARRLARVTFDGIASRYPFVLMLPQDRTERLLREHLAGLGVPIERGLSLTALSDTGVAVQAMLTHADGNVEAIDAPWVIGCDGAHSAVRHALGLVFEGASYQEDWFLLDADATTDWAMDEVHAYLHPAGMLAVFPLGEDRVRLFTQRPPVAGQPAQPLSAAEFQAIIDDRTQPGLKLGEVAWSSAFRVHHRIVRTYGKGRAFVAGDAAHIHSPVGGQGMNTGIQDAYDLAWKLARVHRGTAHPALLATYEAERRPVAAGVLAGTDVMTRALSLRDPVTTAVRNQVIAFATHFDTFRKMVAANAAELAVAYPPSAIVAAHGEGWFGPTGPVAGSRALDGEGQDLAGAPRRLLEALRGNTHVLLLFGGLAALEGDAESISNGTAGASPDTAVDPEADRAAQAATIRAARIALGTDVRVISISADAHSAPPGVDEVLLDVAGTLNRLYGADRPCLFLMRPDKYIGFKDRQPDADRLAAHLERAYGPR